ncbi:MAG: DUF924 domain-containing protein [Okeania sp. SIO2F4]|nr:DUF924 domain-containing protein [Okeania sp. SIO2F4]
MDEVLNYWFEFCPSNNLLSSVPNMNKSFERWFAAKEDIMQSSIWNSVFGEVESWPDTPNAELAKVVLYDQISRGCFRGTSAAFAYDEQAIYSANRFLEFADSYGTNLDSPICLSHSEKKDVQQR